MDKNKSKKRDQFKTEMDRIKNKTKEKIDNGKQEIQPAVWAPKNIVRKSTQEGLKRGWTRATFVLREKWLELLKVYAKSEGRSLKKVVDEALKKYLEGKEIILTGEIPDLRYKDEDDEEE